MSWMGISPPLMADLLLRCRAHRKSKITSSPKSGYVASVSDIKRLHKLLVAGWKGIQGYVFRPTLFYSDFFVQLACFPADQGSEISARSSTLTAEAQHYFKTRRKAFRLLYHHNDSVFTMPAGFSSIVRTTGWRGSVTFGISRNNFLNSISLQGGNNVTGIQGMVMFGTSS